MASRSICGRSRRAAAAPREQLDLCRALRNAPCPTPADVGGTVAPGGYVGSSQNAAGIAAWNAATHVTDGTVTWVCLTPVDYNTFTGANADDPVTGHPALP